VQLIDLIHAGTLVMQVGVLLAPRVILLGYIPSPPRNRLGSKASQAIAQSTPGTLERIMRGIRVTGRRGHDLAESRSTGDKQVGEARGRIESSQ
jgi:hypothetical protein